MDGNWYCKICSSTLESCAGGVQTPWGGVTPLEYGCITHGQQTEKGCMVPGGVDNSTLTQRVETLV